MQPYPIDAHDRALFKQCRRAWDFGARARRNREPAADPEPPSLADALVAALDVYYFPGMWDWNRDVVQPLVHQALDRAALAPEHERQRGHALLDRYAEWARPHDTFAPVRVAADFEVNVPDPLLWERDLATHDGDPVRYAAHVDAVVWGDDQQPGLLCHRVSAGPFTDNELLALDEAALTTCWAWTHFTLDARIAAIWFNQVRIDPDGDSFRRTVIPVSQTEIAIAGRQLGAEALDMLDAAVTLYPNPTIASCAPCPFRAPCLAMRHGEDGERILGERYRSRPTPEPQEGRLGGQTWSMGRGARPPRFGS